jgi:hypothetical protein
MHPLSPISDKAEDVFLGCISKVKDKGLKAKLTTIKADIVKQDRDFVRAGGKAKYFELPSHTTVGAVTLKEMVAVYDQRMVPLSSPGRVYYDKIMALATHEMCPICGHGRVMSLDHYMPKMLFPGLAVSPRNLLPSCSDCNKAKLDSVPTCESKQTINPYYDNCDGEVWLTAKVKKVVPVVIEFSVSPPKSWTRAMARRARYHFAVFKLGRMYSSQAAVEVLDRREELANLLKAAGPSEVKKHLASEAASRTANRRNSWRAALYRALFASNWFCSVGCKG